jgi:hypothetical protein
MIQHLKKYTPIILLLLNSSISAMASSKTLPVPIVAGREPEYLIIAILAAILGTLFGFKSFRYVWLVQVVMGLFLVATIIYYSSLLSFAGLKNHEQYTAAFLYFYIFFTCFSIVTHFERFVAMQLETKE